MRLNGKLWRWLHPQPARLVVPDYVVERVGNGAALLDANKPDWAMRVLPDYIDLTSNEACVLGQVYGNFAWGTRVLRPVMQPVDCSFPGSQLTWYGFCVSGLEELPLFKAEWGRVVDVRVGAHYAAAGR